MQKAGAVVLIQRERRFPLLIWTVRLSALKQFTHSLNPQEKSVLFFVAFVDRPKVRQIISLRRANHLEARHYAKATEANLHPDPYA